VLKGSNPLYIFYSILFYSTLPFTVTENEDTITSAAGENEDNDDELKAIKPFF
jgi:hypothetical protein